MPEILRTVEEWEHWKEQAGPRDHIVFKFSPTCPVSHAIERDFDAWIEQQDGGSLLCAKVDVVRSRPLSQHLAQELGVRHESPQVLWLDGQGQLKWAGSHGQITAQALETHK